MVRNDLSLTCASARAATASATAAAIISAAQRAGRTLLTEVESKQILDAYGIPTVPARIARSEDEAVRIAAELGPPVVLKLYSEIITHKTDVGGVQLNLRGEDQIRRAYRRIEQSVTDKRGAFLGLPSKG